MRGDDVDLTGFGCLAEGDGSVYCTSPDSPYPITPESAAPAGGSEDDVPFGSWLSVDQFLGAAAHSGATPEVLGSGGVALALLGGCLAAADALGRRRAGWTLTPLVAVGSMPLTAYCVHVVALAATSHASADGEPAWLAGGWQLWGLFAATALVGCTLWAARLGRGPLERLLGWTVRRAVRP